MDMRLKLVQFGVSGLADIRILWTRWQAVLSRLGKEAAPAPDIAPYRQVGVEVEWRRPGEEVCLNFVAPPALLECFLNDLKEQRLAFSEEEVIPWMVVKCRLKPRSLQ